MTGFDLLLIAAPVMMILGVMLGLRIGRQRAERVMIEVERVIQTDMTTYLRSPKPVPPPSRQVSEGAFAFEETRISRFRTFVWNVYMKARR